MIDLESLHFYIDFKDREIRGGILREDGFLVVKEDDRIDNLYLKTDKLTVSLHSTEFHKDKKSNAWDFVLPVIKDYFTTVDPEILRPLCSPGILCFSMNRYNEIPDQSEQDDMFIANYTGWVYVQFDYDYQFDTLFSIKEFRKFLNNKHHTHQVHDKGWPETKMFMQELTVENLSSTFQRLIKLYRMEKEIWRAMQKTCNEFYAEHEEKWIEEL